MLTPDQHRRAGELFDLVLDLPGHERAEALRAGCAGDEQLREAVRALLEADSQAPASFMARPAIQEAAALLATSPAPAAGQRLGQYLLGEQIGTGGMGTLHEARDLRLNRRVAIKTLPAAFAADQERLQRFQKEALAISLLNHPNIVTIFDAGAGAEGHPFIATEFVEGQTLRALLARGPVDARQLVEIGTQICAALDAAHGAGVVHRDIKPENIMLRPDGVVKVLDFGLAKLEGQSPEQLQTRPGTVAGTLQYLSPEQVLGKPAVPQSDLFSLGAVLYELATGVRPFSGPSDGAIFEAIVHKAPEHPRHLRPELDRDLDALLMRAIEKDPDLRFQTARDFRSSLRLVGRDSRTATPLRARPAAPAPARAAWLVAALASAGLLGVAWLHWAGETLAPLPAHFDQLTSGASEETYPSLTPDGSQFIYASRLRGNWDIYLQRTGGATAVNLTLDSPADDTQPALSRDGSRIVFRSERDGGGLFVMELTGENRRRIAPRGYFPSWSPDGKHVAYSLETFIIPSIRGAPIGRLVVVDAATGVERTLATADSIQPNWSPHGQRIAYWGKDAAGLRNVFTIGVDAGSNPVAVTADAALDWNPEWSPSGEELYFLSDRGGTMNLWRVAIDETTGQTRGQPLPVTLPVPYATFLNAGATGDLVYAQAEHRTNLYAVGYDPVRQVVTGGVETVAGSRETMHNFSFSPDGQRMVYDAVGVAQEDIWIVNTDGTGRRRLTDDRFVDRFPVWSPAGDRIAFLSGRTGNMEEWVIGVDGSGLRQLTALGRSGIQRPIWSADGTRILAASTIGDPALLDPDVRAPVAKPAVPPGLAGRANLFFWEWPKQGNMLVAQQGGGDTSELFYYWPASGKLAPAGIIGHRPAWLPGGRQFAFCRDGHCLIYDPASKQERHLFSVVPNEVYSIDASRPGRIYFTRTVHESRVWRARMR